MNINNKNKCKVVCKMQCLKNGLQFNVSDGAVSLIELTRADVFSPVLWLMGGQG